MAAWYVLLYRERNSPKQTVCCDTHTVGLEAAPLSMHIDAQEAGHFDMKRDRRHEASILHIGFAACSNPKCFKGPDTEST